MMICCNTGARTRRLTITRARFRAYGVHRVLDELLEVLGIRRVEEFADNLDVCSRLSELKDRASVVYRRFRWRWGRDIFKILYACMWKILSPRVSSTPMHSCETHPHDATRTRVYIYTKRANRLNFLSSTSSPIIHLDLKTNYNLVCREEGFDFCSVEKISSDLSLFFSFSLFPARASVHVWWDDELFQFDFHAHWRVSIIASYHLIQYYYNVNCEY